MNWLRLSLLLALTTPTPGLWAQDEEGDRQLAEVERFYRYAAKQSDRAEKMRFMAHSIPLYEKYLWNRKTGPNAAMARFHLGHAQQTLGQIHNARRSYELVISRHKTGQWVGSAARQLAYLNLTEKNYKAAAKYFGIASYHVPGEGLRHTAVTKQAQCLLLLNANQEVLGVLKRIGKISGHPHREWAIYKSGQILFEMERYADSIEAFRPLLEGAASDSSRTQALFYTGLCAAEMGDGELAETNLRAVLDTPHDQASQTLEERRRIAHNKAMAQNSLMGMYLRGEDYEEVGRLYRLGKFGATGKLEAIRSERAGRAFYKLKRWDQARTAYRRVDRAMPNTEKAFSASFMCLKCDYQLRHPGLGSRVDVFLELYRKRFPKAPQIQTALFLKAQTLYNNGRLEQAAQAFNNIKTKGIIEEFQPDLLYKRGYVLAETGDFNGATRSISFFLRDYSDDPRATDAMAMRGEAYERLGDRVSALKDFTSILENEETPAQLRAFALQRSAAILREEKNVKGMVQNYRELLTRFSNLPNDTVANSNYWIGWGYYKLKEYDEAIPYLKKAREMTPEFHRESVGKVLVLIHFAKGDSKAMDEELTDVLKLKPNKAIPKHMLTWLGSQMFHAGNFESTVLYLKRAITPEAINPRDVAVWRMMAKAQNETSRYKEGLISAKIAIAIEKEPRWRADTHLDIALSLVGLGRNDEAQAQALKGLAIPVKGPHLAGLHLVMGEVAFVKNNFEKAYEEALATLRIAIDDPLIKPRALFLAAEASEKLGSQEESNRYRRQLRQSYPGWQAPAPVKVGAAQQ